MGFQIGDWVSFYSKTRKRFVSGLIVQFNGKHAMIIVTTWDGRGHHWWRSLKRLQKIDMGFEQLDVEEKG